MKSVLIAVLVIAVLGIAGFWVYVHKSINATPSSSPTTSNSPAPQSAITFPQGGETFKPGQTITLKWAGGGADPTQIFLVNKAAESQGVSVSLFDRVYNVQNSGSYDYTFPATLPEGSYKFQIGDLNSSYFELSSKATAFCTPAQLQAQINPSPGAGNVFAQATIKNTSSTTCQIQPNFLEVDYPLSVTNIKVTNQGQKGTSPLTLNPNQTVYGQLHYPNGPQCSGPTLGVNAAASVKISDKDTITFVPQGSSTNTLDIQTCEDPKQMTEVQSWPLSPNPITQ